ncbi:MAG: cation:proton antiporter subunit C [Proteobacteria bacterium]|nr:cation:proton antiporter subunit C [Pseudomonadota bacterium]
MNILGLYNYWIVVILILIGFYIVIAHENLIKKLVGLTIFQTAVFFFYISVGKIKGATAPILNDSLQVYSNPLPHCLILTAIVVGISTTALGLALVVRIQEAYGSIEEHELHAQDNNDQLESQLEAYGTRKQFNIMKRT